MVEAVAKAEGFEATEEEINAEIGTIGSRLQHAEQVRKPSFTRNAET